MHLTSTDWVTSSLTFSADKRKRFTGLHVSQISRSLCEARGIDKNPNKMTPEQVNEYAVVGFLEERMSVALMESMADGPGITQPPVVAFNGERTILLGDDDPIDAVPEGEGFVIGTPDWLELEIADEVEQLLTDCKGTYKSLGAAATPDTWVRKNRWDWELNTLFYALALRVGGYVVDRIRFRVLFMAGDYRPVRPMRRIWTSGPLSDAELWDNWSLLRQHAKENGWL
jgi:hypothetical protein